MKGRALKPDSQSIQRPESAGMSGPAAQATTGNDLAAIFSEISAVHRAINKLSLEMHAIRRERLPDAPAAIEELCSAIHGVFGERYFGAQ